MKGFEKIERLILTNFKATRSEIYGKSRKRYIIDARRTMMHFLRKQLTLQEIGRIFNCDHATVIHHLKQFEFLKDQEPYNNKIKLIEAELYFKPLKRTDDDFVKRIMQSIVWEEKGTTRKNIEKLFTYERN